MNQLREKKRLVFILVLLVTVTLAKAQTIVPKDSLKVKNVIWFTPCGADKINGLAVGLQALPANEKHQLIINGVNADVALLSAMMIPYIVVYHVSSKAKRELNFSEPDTSTIINGLSLSMFGEMDVMVNGINIAGGNTAASALNGISLTGFTTFCRSFKGIVISGLHNKAINGTGLQIALFNNCTNLKGLQIGLWNKSGKRGLPFINWGI